MDSNQKDNIIQLVQAQRELFDRLSIGSSGSFHKTEEIDTFTFGSEEEEVEIIKLSDSGDEMIYIKSKIKSIIKNGESTFGWNYRVSIDGNNNYQLTIPKSKMSTKEMIKENLKMEILSIYANFYNQLNPSKLIIIKKPFFIKFINRETQYLAKCTQLQSNETIKFSEKNIQSFGHFVDEISGKKFNISNVYGFSDGLHDVYENFELKELAEGVESHRCNNLCDEIKSLTVREGDFKSHELFRIASINYFSSSIPMAIEYYEKSGNSNSLNNLGLIYHYGKDSIKPDINKSIEYYQKSSETGNPKALCNLGIVYNFGKDTVKVDIPKAMEYYQKSGDSRALCKLGVIFRDGKDQVKSDVSKAIELFTKSSNSEAFYNLAMIYHFGKLPIKADLYLAVEYYEKSSDLDNCDALFNLGSIYHHGKDPIVCDIDLTVMYYKRAAELGHSKAQYHLGIIYQLGKEPVKPDMKLAFEYFKNSADSGYSVALNRIAHLYHYGNDLIQSDMNLAIEYYKKSAALSDSDAYYKLGLIYHSGKDSINPDIYLAIQYYKKAGDMGNKDALNRLHDIYDNAKGSNQQESSVVMKYFKSPEFREYLDTYESKSCNSSQMSINPILKDSSQEKSECEQEKASKSVQFVQPPPSSNKSLKKKKVKKSSKILSVFNHPINQICSIFSHISRR